MPFTEPRTYSWTQEEFYWLTNQERFFEKRVELIDGEIIEYPAASNFHSASRSLTRMALEQVFGAAYWVREHFPLDLEPCSLPEPDLAAVPGNPREYPEHHPQTALLVVEISEVSLFIDQSRKAKLYARCGIADYWIVNLIDRQVEVYRRPVADAAFPHIHAYADRDILSLDDSISPLVWPAATIPVTEFFPNSLLTK